MDSTARRARAPRFTHRVARFAGRAGGERHGYWSEPVRAVFPRSTRKPHRDRGELAASCRAAGGRISSGGSRPGVRPVSLGTFNTDSSGRALASLAVPAGLRIAVTAVTEEPAGGSAQPTTTPFLAATWKSEYGNQRDRDLPHSRVRRAAGAARRSAGGRRSRTSRVPRSSG